MSEHTLETFVEAGQAAQKGVNAEIAKANGQARLRALNPTRFLCRSEVRKFLLEHARSTRTHKFDRVSEETLVAINERVRAVMIEQVHRLPSKGKTI